MATLSDIGLSQPASSTITMKLRTTTLDVNSTVVHSEVLVIGDGESTLALSRVLSSTPASTTWGLAVRQVREHTFNSTSSTVTSTASTAVYPLVSSVASQRICVYAFAVMSTSPTAIVGEFLSSNAQGSSGVVWAVDSGAGQTGGNLAVTPPARLFHTTASEALNLRLSSTGKEVRYCLSWFVE